MKKSGIGFALLTVFLVCVISLCFGMTALGREKRKEAELDYRAKEAQLLKETRERLAASGFTNSGVTLTRIVDGEGSREYTFTIHHGRIDRMEEQEREELRLELEAFCAEAGSGFPPEVCSFRCKFLVL